MIVHSPYPDLDIPAVTLPQLVLQHAARLADKPALIDAPSGRTLTYRQLADGVRCVAAALHARGLRPGDVLAIFSPNLPEYALALYGAQLAGATVTTINPLATTAELATQLRDARAVVLFTVPPLLAVAQPAAAQASVRELVVFGEAAGATPFAALREHAGSPPVVAIDVERHLACLPYSSGTTGTPKGVMLSHRNLVANVLQVHRVVPLWTGDDVFLAVLPFFHIFGMTAILSAQLANGATVVTLPHFDLEQVLATIQHYHITVAHLVPPIMLLLAQHPLVERYDLSSLRSICTGAAPISAAVLRQVAQRLGCRIIQGYGMTELSNLATMTTDDLDEVVSGTVGWLAPNMALKVVDVVTGAELEPGAPGEICVRGPNVMRGYLNRPDATQATIDADGWLHTGDTGYVDAQDRCFVVDRIKELIKVNAYQVAPAELEAVLLSHPAVLDAAVIGVPDAARGEVPKAFVVTRSAVSAAEIMAYVAARVAPYKKVRTVEFVDGIPKSPSGKILRRVLIARERETMAAADRVAPEMADVGHTG